MSTEPLIFELSSPGRTGFSLPEVDMDEAPRLDPSLLREELDLPEVSEVDVVRHFTRLSQKNYSIDTGFYPLGSCTMKYNPKLHEDVSIMPGWAHLHPYTPVEGAQGALQLQYELQDILAELVGMDACTLQPAAGAHGEFTGVLMIRAYHRSRGDYERDIILVPDSAHGTNPATAAAVGMRMVSLKSGPDGSVDLATLEANLSDRVAGMMLTVPNTLGLFEPQILEICEMVHKAGGLMYGDGANLNALVGHIRPGDLGFDVMHLNLHKTFTTPHGGGGPGSGPVACKEFLAPFLPKPIVAEKDGKYAFVNPDKSIGRVKNFWGNFGMHVRAYTYIRHLGLPGLKRVSEDAILNANYVRVNLMDTYHLQYNRICMHECVLSSKNIKAETGISTKDVAKRLIDYGMHPPTVYFPLIVEEALMIEPTETESKETLDQFIAAMKAIAREAHENPDIVHSAPNTTELTRLDEVTAAREPNLRWKRPAKPVETPPIPEPALAG
jgi:glycine cleavage system P protein (glycine dehydrogenase) subunit 2